MRSCRSASVVALMMWGTCSFANFSFENVTLDVVDRVAGSDFKFDALWTDFNGDGCYDAFIYDHHVAYTSRYWINKCDGSHEFILIDNEEARYSIPEPLQPRGSGWMTALDLDGDTRQDFWLRDTGPSARYINRRTLYSDPEHYFSHKEYMCSGKVGCQVGDLDGDKILDVVLKDRSVTSLHGGLVFPPSGPSATRLIVDINSNGWPDLMQPESGGYWRNDGGNLVWSQQGFATASNLSERAEGLNQQAAADFDNDGDLDYVVLAVSVTDMNGLHLYRNDGGMFPEASYGLPGITFQEYFTSYGNIVPADFDNDGRVDLAIAGAQNGESSVMLLRNVGNLQFVVVGNNLGRSDGGEPWETGKSKLAVADYDFDGFLDIVKTQMGTNVGIHRNTTNNGNNWLRVRVRNGTNTDGLHTQLRVYSTATQGRLGLYEVMANSQHPQTHPHFGLGQHELVDLDVRFPHGGPTYRFSSLSVNQEVIVYPNGCLLRNWQPGHGYPPSPPQDCVWKNSFVDDVFANSFE